MGNVLNIPRSSGYIYIYNLNMKFLGDSFRWLEKWLDFYGTCLDIRWWLEKWRLHKFWKERFELWIWKEKHMSKHTWEMKGDEWWNMVNLGWKNRMESESSSGILWGSVSSVSLCGMGHGIGWCRHMPNQLWSPLQACLSRAYTGDQDWKLQQSNPVVQS